ncbi:MAG: VCBS repeat-containing protein [Myxococcota bacterium]
MLACSTPGTVNILELDEDLEVDTDPDEEESSGAEEAIDPFEGARVIEAGLKGRFEFGDYDGDGIDDLISEDDDWLRIHRFDTAEQELEQFFITSFSANFHRMMPAHVDDDDELDLVLYDPATPTIGEYDNRLIPVALSSGSVDFGPAAVIQEEVIGTMVDFDRDGRTDLLERSANALRSWSMNRDGTWTEGQSLAGLPNVEIRGTLWHDVTLDGRLDLLIWGHDSGRTMLTTYAQGEDGILSVLQERELEFRGDVGLADFDDDGIVDLALSRERTLERPAAAILVLQGRGDGTYGGSLLHLESGPNATGGPHLFGVDLDGDGVPEPIVRNTGSIDHESDDGLLSGVGSWNSALIQVEGEGEDEVTVHPLPTDMWLSDAADIDGDGCDELVGKNSENWIQILKLPCD